jgi:hypothetical protein
MSWCRGRECDRHHHNRRHSRSWVEREKRTHLTATLWFVGLQVGDLRGYQCVLEPRTLHLL